MAGHQKSSRAAGDGNPPNNMNVGFVPLISIIANLLPRFFTRYATVPQATVQQARSICKSNCYKIAGMVLNHPKRLHTVVSLCVLAVQDEEPIECQNFEHVGLKWLDHLSPSTFYQCHFSKYCSSHQVSFDKNNLSLYNPYSVKISMQVFLFQKSCFQVRKHFCKQSQTFDIGSQKCISSQA